VTVSYTSIALTGGVFRLLALLVLVALLVLAIVTRRRYPRSAPFLVLGFAALVLDNLIGFVWSFAGPALGASGPGYRLGLLAVDVVAGLISLAGLALLGVALFLRRPPEQPAAPPAGPPAAGPPPVPYYGTQPNAPQPGPAGPPPPPPAQPGPGGAAPLWPGTPPN
jgi:hypothetical protein